MEMYGAQSTDNLRVKDGATHGYTRAEPRAWLEMWLLLSPAGLSSWCRSDRSRMGIMLDWVWCLV